MYLGLESFLLRCWPFSSSLWWVADPCVPYFWSSSFLTLSLDFREPCLSGCVICRAWCDQP